MFIVVVAQDEMAENHTHAWLHASPGELNAVCGCTTINFQALIFYC